MSARRQPPVTGFTLRDPLPWRDFAHLARRGEDLGYGAVLLPEVGARDTFAALTGLASETTRLQLGTGVVPMTARDGRTTAMGAATVQERSGGRAMLGIGTGPARKGAIATLEAEIARLRPWLGWPTAAAADATPSTEAVLPGLQPVPIWIAALGPRAVRLAGTVADGVILNWCNPERVAQARTAIRESAAAAGRDPDRVTIAVYVRALFGVDPPEARSALMHRVAEYAGYPAYARQFAAMGMDAADPGAVVDAICLYGDPDAGRARFETYRAAGADLPVLYPVLPPGGGADEVARTLEALSPAD